MEKNKKIITIKAHNIWDQIVRLSTLHINAEEKTIKGPRTGNVYKIITDPFCEFTYKVNKKDKTILTSYTFQDFIEFLEEESKPRGVFGFRNFDNFGYL